MIPDLKHTISVVIPTYNRASMIVACIGSVLAQSYPVNEIIVVDDGSTDDTLKQLNILKDNIIILKTEKQSGAQAARNIGIKAAKSGWIAFLDSDDEWLPNKIEKQVKELEKLDFDPFTVVHGDCFVLRTEKKEKKIWNLPVINGVDVYTKLLKHPSPMFQGMLTSKKAFVKINYLDDKIPSYQEWDTAIRLAKFCKFIHIQEPLFIYNIHNNTISSNSDLSIEGYQYIINKHKDEINKVCGEEVLINHMIINSIMALNNNKNKLGRAILKQIPNNYFKKSILQLFSYLKIKPMYVKKIKQFILRKR
ncbi:MAG: glycosyltransferase family 2 protein [Candidatus Neomarinimicrobiota bacterium]